MFSKAKKATCTDIVGNRTFSNGVYSPRGLSSCYS